jgi:hypothetical protein
MGASVVAFIDEASIATSGEALPQAARTWSLVVYRDGSSFSGKPVAAYWQLYEFDCSPQVASLRATVAIDRHSKIVGAIAQNAQAQVRNGTPLSGIWGLACGIAQNSGPRLASTQAAIAASVPATLAKGATIATSPSADPKTAARPATPTAGLGVRLPATKTEKTVFQAVKDNQFQAAVSAMVRAPGGKPVAVAELADQQGMTALHWAAANRNIAGMRWLLDKGAKVDLADKMRRTPLKIALDNKDTRAMTMLLDKGADPRLASPGHDEDLKSLKKTSEIVDFLIMVAAPAAN